MESTWKTYQTFVIVASEYYASGGKEREKGMGGRRNNWEKVAVQGRMIREKTKICIQAVKIVNQKRHREHQFAKDEKTERRSKTK